MGPADDACNSTHSENYSDAASNNNPRLALRAVARSTSLRSSTASSDGMSSPSNPRRSHPGASRVHSFFNAGPANEGYDGLASAFEAGPTHSSHSFFSNREYGQAPAVPPRTLSPETGVHSLLKSSNMPACTCNPFCESLWGSLYSCCVSGWRCTILAGGPPSLSAKTWLAFDCRLPEIKPSPR